MPAGRSRRPGAPCRQTSPAHGNGQGALRALRPCPAVPAPALPSPPAAGGRVASGRLDCQARRRPGRSGFRADGPAARPLRGGSSSSGGHACPPSSSAVAVAVSGDAPGAAVRILAGTDAWRRARRPRCQRPRQGAPACSASARGPVRRRAGRPSTGRSRRTGESGRGWPSPSTSLRSQREVAAAPRPAAEESRRRRPRAGPCAASRGCRAQGASCPKAARLPLQPRGLRPQPHGLLPVPEACVAEGEDRVLWPTQARQFAKSASSIVHRIRRAKEREPCRRTASRSKCVAAVQNMRMTNASGKGRPCMGSGRALVPCLQESLGRDRSAGTSFSS